MICCTLKRGGSEHRLKRKSENGSQIIAVPVEPAIEQRLRLLAEVAGLSQSFFLIQLIGKGIERDDLFPNISRS
jgi:hypothetical protein